MICTKLSSTKVERIKTFLLLISTTKFQCILMRFTDANDMLVEAVNTLIFQICVGIGQVIVRIKSLRSSQHEGKEPGGNMALQGLV